jgi:hypothetical protein
MNAGMTARGVQQRLMASQQSRVKKRHARLFEGRSLGRQQNELCVSSTWLQAGTRRRRRSSSMVHLQQMHLCRHH